VLLLADLPERFTWTDIAEVWDVNRRTAFYRIRKFLEKDQLTPGDDKYASVTFLHEAT